MNLSQTNTEAEAVALLTLEAEKGIVHFIADGNREFVALPNANGGYDLEQITQDNAADVKVPKLVTANVKVQTAGSLGDYINRFKNYDTSLFADIASDTIVAIVDYHKMPGANMLDNPSVATEGQSSDHDAHAQLNLHRVTLKLPKSMEWDIWMGRDGKLMKHIEFASFIEENGIDVTEPSGGALLDMCRDLQVKAGVSFNSSIRYGDAVSIEYQKGDDVSTKDNLQLPSEIKLSIPVYFGEPPIQLTAYLRREINDGKLSLGYKISRAEMARQAEFHRIVNELMTTVDHLPMVYGTPA